MKLILVSLATLKAGSGKSTLVKFIIAALNINNEDVRYVAYTGKAANVLKQKGCPNAITAHKLLYRAKPLPNGTFKFEKRAVLEGLPKLIIVDEVSMIPVEMWNLLLSHKIPIIACGDPEQLPPIDPEEDNHVLNNPHIFLDEIMRQAKESEIIRLSMHIREGKPLKNFECLNQQVMIINKDDLNSGTYEWADQIICAKNETRNNINNIIRNIKGFGEKPEIGDKIISLRNHWEFFSSDEHTQPLINGSIGTINHFQKSSLIVPRYIYDKIIPVLYVSMDTDNEESFIGIPVDYNSLLYGEKTLSNKQEYQMKKNKNCPDPPFEFTYAYGITCWKAQGSEWDKVLLFEENWPRGELGRKYLYTGITRASEKLVIVQK